MHRSNLHAIDLRPSRLSGSIGESVFNGFCGIHYAIINGRWSIVKLLLDYELCDVTRARVLMDAPGVGRGKRAVVPIGTNCLQLALLAGQRRIFMRLVDEITARNTAKLIDPVQASFGKKAPLTVQDKLALLVMKNELEQNVLATMACCRAIWDETSLVRICMEF